MKASIIRLPETDSTNNYAVRLLANNQPPEGTVIITDNQTRGKGLDTNHWESEPGKNLTFSIILYPDFTADKQFLLNKAISLGIRDFLIQYLPDEKITIKWPNDIYINDQKACGILIQNAIRGNNFEYVIAGIGLNVNQELFMSDAPNPVSMKNITGRDYDLDILFEDLLRFVFNRYQQAGSDKYVSVQSEYQNALYRYLEWHQYIVRGSKHYCRILGTNPYGQLLLETETQNDTVLDIKEVKFLF